ncbi:hypothetical protein ACO1O0_008877 [Amphichorda felina]
MDDPWGSPWATDDAPTPKIDLPTAPPPVIANGAGSSGRRRSNFWGSGGGGGVSDDNEDDAWGGWNDAATVGTASPGWGRSPGLRPVPAAASRDPSPGPWDKRSEDRATDSAISLGRGTAGAGLEAKTPSAVAFDAYDVWQAKEPMGPTADESPASPTMVDTPARSESPDIPPPGPALRPDQRPEAMRPGSKVQGLVEMYDGISRRSASPGVQESATPSPEKIHMPEDSSEDESPAPRIVSPTPTLEKEHDEVLDSEPFQNGDSADEACDREPFPNDVSVDDFPCDEKIPEQDDTTKDKAPRPKAPAMNIPIDLSKLDDLFPSISPSNPDPEPLPDVIIDDTFASSSERKAWYRISRFGPMRKHDMGNDENYVRMDWAHSTVRADTLRIVRRWMEEDSIAGRVVLGGRQKGPIGASMFNWDSTAPATEIGELLRRKKGHSKEPSVGSKVSAASPVVASFGWSSPTSSPTAVSFPPPPEKRLSVRSPTAAAFPAAPECLPGASPTATSFPSPPGPSPAVASFSAARDPLPAARPPPPPPKSRPQSLFMPSMPTPGDRLASRSKQRPQSLIMPPSRAIERPSIDQALAMSIASPPAAPSPLQASIAAGEDGDDDDWGEMVSSPTVPANGGFQESALADDWKDAKQPSSPPPPVGTENPTISPRAETSSPWDNTEADSDTWASGDVHVLAGGQSHYIDGDVECWIYSPRFMGRTGSENNSEQVSMSCNGHCHANGLEHVATQACISVGLGAGKLGPVLVLVILQLGKMMRGGGFAQAFPMLGLVPAGGGLRPSVANGTQLPRAGPPEVVLCGASVSEGRG